MSDENLKNQFLALTRTQPRLTVKDANKYINRLLFDAHEAGDLSRLLSSLMTLPISMSTTHTWLTKLGCASASGPPSRTALTPKRRRSYSSTAVVPYMYLRGESVPRKETPAR